MGARNIKPRLTDLEACHRLALIEEAERDSTEIKSRAERERKEMRKWQRS
jgi:hypothetical protein